MVTRRSVLKGIAVMPLGAVLADPELAAAAADSLQTVSITAASGVKVSGSLAVPDNSPAGAVLLIHEWWGLNDQIKSVAAELGKIGYLALAADLYEQKVTTDPDTARQYMQQVDSAVAAETLVAWGEWLRSHPQGNGKVATIGWCFGGGWSLNASLSMPVDATIIYYGNVQKNAADTAILKGSVLGHFATQDQWINAEMVEGFEQALEASGKTFTHYWYDAQHGFANPTTARYDADDAATAWSRTLDFLAEHIA